MQQFTLTGGRKLSNATGAQKIKAANAITFTNIKRDREAALRTRNAYRLAIGLPPVMG